MRAPPAQGLDYGCGPNPVLCQLLEKENYQMSFYDPYFFPTDLNKISSLDFITCTEAAEHFYHPGQEFKKILSFIKPQGFLFLMTDLVQKEVNLSTWFYAKDPSHVCFFFRKKLCAGWPNSTI